MALNDNQNMFLGFWSHEGIESIQDITHCMPEQHQVALLEATVAGDQEQIQHLSDIRAGLNSMIHRMEMRARFNSQRDYEIWYMYTDSAITMEILRDIAQQDPQQAVDLFRSHGVNIYDDRTPDRRVIS